MRNITFGVLFALWSACAVAATPIPVFTEGAKIQPIFNILSYPARVESRVNATVRSESDGVVTRILKPLGSSVRRGEIIAVLKHTDPVFQYAPLNVPAPVSGVVNEVDVTLGSLVNKGDPVVTVTDPRMLRVIIEVAAMDLGSITTGLGGDLTINGLKQPMTAKIQGISPSINPMLGTATCELKVSGADQKRILPGMIGNIQFKVNQRQGFLLPDSAIVYQGDATFVRLIDAGKAKRMPVTVGERRQGQVEIISGLKNGDQVIDRTSRFVGEGDAVEVETAHD